MACRTVTRSPRSWLLAAALVQAIVVTVALARECVAKWRSDGGAGLRAAALSLARERGILIVCAAVMLPLGFLIVQRATIYDGIRHVIIPMLAILAGVGWAAILPLLRRAPIVAAVAVGAYVGSLVATLAALHPLEYIAMSALSFIAI